jgi:hypothetical protein
MGALPMRAPALVNGMHTGQAAIVKDTVYEINCKLKQ